MRHDFSDASDYELLIELQRRNNAKRDRAHQLIIEHVDTLLTIVPEHGRRDCNDTERNHAQDGQCLRCFLLDLKEFPYWPSDMELEFRISKLE